jgi:hypothetical protein
MESTKESNAENAPKRVRTRPVDVVDLTTEDNAVSSTKATTSVVTKISESGIETHGLVALSKYFATKMVAMDGYVPLTVFNTQWLRQDLLRKSIRERSIKEKLDDSYVGLTVPVEWKMTFGEWVVAFDLFVSYLEYYKWNELAIKFKTHKENVFAIKRENSNWPIAFRYDLAVRTTVMMFRQSDGSIANPALRDERLEREAQRDTERLNDFQPAFKEINPYADGEVKASIDPITGVDTRPHTNAPSQFNKPTIRSQGFSSQFQSFSLPVYNGPGGPNATAWEERKYENRGGRPRNRRGSWQANAYGRERSPQRRRFNGSGEAWRRDDKRDERRNDDRDVPGQGDKAK